MIVAEYDKKGCFSLRYIITVALPILLSMLMEHIVGMTDTAFLGRVSEVALGGAALGSVYFLAFFVLGTGFSFGAQILIARRNGEKNFAQTGQICYAGGGFLLLFALLLMVGIKYLSPVILPEIINSPDVAAATEAYLNWRAYGLVFAFVAAIFRAFFVGIANTKILTISSIVMVLSNIVLNYGLIFGKYGLPEMGIAGAALASSIAEALAMVCYIVYTLKFVDLEKYGFRKRNILPESGILKKVFSVSFWMMLQPFISVAVWFFFFIAVERLGERPLAVINLARTISALPFIIIQSFATAANSLVSNLIGDGRAEQVWRLIGKTIMLATVIVVPLLVGFAVFPEYCLRLYTPEHDLIAASVNVLYVMCIASGIQIFAFILFNSVSGTGAVKTTVFIEFVSLLVYVVFVWFAVVVRRSSPAIAWTAEIVYQGVTVIGSLLFLLLCNWRNKKI